MAYRFETENSEYLVDEEAHTVTRYPKRRSPITRVINYLGWQFGSGELRQDGEAVPYLTLPRPVVGRPVAMLLAIRDDAVTIRTTSTVLRVE